jgi:hypothetical protein
MTSGVEYFWPLFAAGLVIGAVAGLIGFRAAANRRRRVLGIGFGLALASALLWHWPLGGASRFVAAVETEARGVLVDWEMGAVTARLQRDPLTRRLELSGPADSFQRRELSRLMDFVPGVGGATWSKSRWVPLAAEGATMSLLAFFVGLLFAYLVELRRRYNAQWSW